MITIASIVHAVATFLFDHGARNVLSSDNIGGNGWVATKHTLTIVCHIPSSFQHGTFRCAGWLKR